MKLGRKGGRLWCIRRLQCICMTLILSVCLVTGIRMNMVQSLAANGPDVCAPCYVVMNAATGELICEKNMNVQCYPASITKIMTAMVVYEQLSAEQLNDVLTFSYDAVNTNLDIRSTTLDPTAKEGEQMTVNDALHGMMMPSANECANALAEYVAGSNAAFAELMNQKAEELGLENTHFVNPHGIDDENQYVSCYDMAVIMRAAIQIPECRELLGCVNYTIPATNLSQQRELTAGHGYVNGEYAYEGVICGKGGKTVLAKRTLVTCVDRDGIELIAVVLNDEESRAYFDTQVILDFSFGYLKGEIEEVNWEPMDKEIWPIDTAGLYEYCNTCYAKVEDGLDENTKLHTSGLWDNWYVVEYNGVTCFAYAPEWTDGVVVEATPTPTPKPDNPFYQNVKEPEAGETAAYTRESREDAGADFELADEDYTPRGPVEILWLFTGIGLVSAGGAAAVAASLAISHSKQKHKDKRRH